MLKDKTINHFHLDKKFIKQLNLDGFAPGKMVYLDTDGIYKLAYVSDDLITSCIQGVIWEVIDESGFYLNCEFCELRYRFPLTGEYFNKFDTNSWTFEDSSVINVSTCNITASTPITYTNSPDYTKGTPVEIISSSIFGTFISTGTSSCSGIKQFPNDFEYDNIVTSATSESKLYSIVTYNLYDSDFSVMMTISITLSAESVETGEVREDSPNNDYIPGQVGNILFLGGNGGYSIAQSNVIVGYKTNYGIVYRPEFLNYPGF